ncbi:MAG TPA: plastocyanin/azurin family copper-binding protein [Blastocatellia bacterium]|nr:plastocyanin/azurin family copper-binding protein [Blastocatellia bacterium]
MRRLMIICSISILLMAAAVSSAMRPGVSGRSGATAAPVAEKATVKVSSFQFTPKVLTVAPGTTVEWVNEAGRHSVEADDGSFKSGVLKQGDKFEHKFDKAGTYAYHCEFHGEKGGKDMAGKIIVRGVAKK